jgi:membrane protein DedA with SNARE-associated domain
MQGFLQSWGYVAIILFGVLEAACIPISSEMTFLLGGALASAGFSATHHLNLALVIIVGTLAEIVGSYIAYAVGRVGGHPLVRRWGRYVLVTESDLSRAERFLAGRGAWAVPIARMAPFVRTFGGLACGLVDIPPVLFGVLNAIGTLIYVIVLSSIGYALGGQWSKIDHGITDVSYLLVAIVVLAIIAFVLHRLRQFRREAAAAGAPSRYAGEPRDPAVTGQAQAAPQPYAGQQPDGPSRGRHALDDGNRR